MNNKTPNESMTTWEPPPQDPRGGGRGRGKPLPRGVEESILKLNHLSPEGWWDYTLCGEGFMLGLAGLNFGAWEA